MDPGFEIQDPGSGIRDPGSRIRDSRSGIRDPGSGKKPIPDPGSGSRGQKGTGSRIRNNVINCMFSHPWSRWRGGDGRVPGEGGVAHPLLYHPLLVVPLHQPLVPAHTPTLNTVSRDGFGHFSTFLGAPMILTVNASLRWLNNVSCLLLSFQLITSRL